MGNAGDETARRLTPNAGCGKILNRSGYLASAQQMFANYQVQNGGQHALSQPNPEELTPGAMKWFIN